MPRQSSSGVVLEKESSDLHYSDVMTFVEANQLRKEEMWEVVGISASTHFRYLKKDPVLKPETVDRVRRMQRLHRQALEVFEDVEETNRWMATPKAYLQGQTPWLSLATDEGAKRVEEMLYRAEYGMFG